MPLLSLSKLRQPAGQHMLTTAPGPPAFRAQGPNGPGHVFVTWCKEDQCYLSVQKHGQCNSQVGQTDRWSKQHVPKWCPFTALFCGLRLPHWAMSSLGTLCALGTQRFRDLCVRHVGTEVVRAGLVPRAWDIRAPLSPCANRVAGTLPRLVEGRSPPAPALRPTLRLLLILIQVLLNVSEYKIQR